MAGIRSCHNTYMFLARNLYILRPLRKAISLQLALFAFERLSLKAPIFEGEGTSNEEVVLHNGFIAGIWVRGWNYIGW